MQQPSTNVVANCSDRGSAPRGAEQLEGVATDARITHGQDLDLSRYRLSLNRRHTYGTRSWQPWCNASQSCWSFSDRSLAYGKATAQLREGTNDRDCFQPEND